MKKTVKSLIVAASVAAIAGIGAVSFAAWDANATKTVNETGATTSVVTTIGNISVTGNHDKNLAPYDQSTSNAVLADADAVEMWTLTVANDATSDTGVEYYIGLTEALNTAKKGDAELYFSTDYDGTSEIDLDDWTKLETVVVTTAGSENYGHKLGGKTVYVILDASGSDAQTMDIKLTFAAVQGDAE
ncbi:MAG: hypothetical protein K2M47_06250 [Clostridiales bacterium]|nr:hypothetical protein [Clostridiales bacterium]